MNVELVAGIALFAAVLFWAGWVVRDLLDEVIHRRRIRLARRRRGRWAKRSSRRPGLVSARSPR